MPIYTKTTVPNLVYNQRVLTQTVASDIGINQLVATINANFSDIEKLLDKNQIGLSDTNIVTKGITNISTNLFCQKIESLSGGVTTSTGGNFATGGAGNVRANTAVTFVKPNTSLMVFAQATYEPNTNVPITSRGTYKMFFQLSLDPTFVAGVTTMQIENHLEQDNGTSFTYKTVTLIDSVVVPVSGNYYVRLTTDHKSDPTISINNLTARAVLFMN